MLVETLKIKKMVKFGNLSHFKSECQIIQNDSSDVPADLLFTIHIQVRHPITQLETKTVLLCFVANAGEDSQVAELSCLLDESPHLRHVPVSQMGWHMFPHPSVVSGLTDQEYDSCSNSHWKYELKSVLVRTSIRLLGRCKLTGPY